MSLESKIAEILSGQDLTEAYPGAGKNKEGEPSKQGSSEKPTVEKMHKDGEAKSGTSSKKLGPKVAAMESEPEEQGSSEEADIDSRDDQSTQGLTQSKKMKKTTNLPVGRGAGNAPNFTTHSDPRSAINQPNSKGNVYREQVDELFYGEENLSEEFKSKASSLFEAVVSARVAELREQLEEEAAQQAAEYVLNYSQELVESVDQYLTYVAEQWLEQNEVSVENAIRADITESFMEGLRNLFLEHNLDIPEESVDVLESLHAEMEEVKDIAEAHMEEAMELRAALTEAHKELVFLESTRDLAQSEAEKLRGLVEDVEFENAEIFEEKLEVIKNSFLSKKSSVVAEEEQLGGEVLEEEHNPMIAQFAERI